MNNMKYSTTIKLFNSYFDSNNNLSPKAILNIFQDVAAHHAETIGVGYETMLEKNLFWIITRIKFDILKMPQINETVLVETWPHEKGRIDFDRDMKILSQTGETLIVATSKWCVIDSISRTLKRTDNINYSGSCCTEKNYDVKFEKIQLPQVEPQQTFSYKVCFSDLDHNQHMNNTNYANIISNAIKNKIITHFEINFLSECNLNDEILVSTIETDSGEYIQGKTNDKISFVAYTN